MQILSKIAGFFGRLLIIIGVSFLLIQFIVLKPQLWSDSIAGLPWEKIITPENLAEISSKEPNNDLTPENLRIIIENNPDFPQAIGNTIADVINNTISFLQDPDNPSPTIVDLEKIIVAVEEAFAEVPQLQQIIDSQELLPDQITLEQSFSEINPQSELTLEESLRIVGKTIRSGPILLLIGLLLLLAQYGLAAEPKLKETIISVRKLSNNFFFAFVINIIFYGIIAIDYQSEAANWQSLFNNIANKILLPTAIIYAVLWIILFLVKQSLNRMETQAELYELQAKAQEQANSRNPQPKQADSPTPTVKMN